MCKKIKIFYECNIRSCNRKKYVFLQEDCEKRYQYDEKRSIINVNEDFYQVMEICTADGTKILLAVVGDGMGGLFEAHRASRVAVLAFSDLVGDRIEGTTLGNVSPPDKAVFFRHLLTEGVVAANMAVLEMCSEIKAECGSTLTACLLFDDTAVTANVGDSPLYLFHEGKMERKSEIHNWSAYLNLSKEDGQYHDLRRRLTHYIGEGRYPHKISIEIFPVCPQDTILMGSDGAFGEITEQELRRVCKKFGGDIESMGSHLLKRARMVDKEMDDQTLVLFSI